MSKKSLTELFIIENIRLEEKIKILEKQLKEANKYRLSPEEHKRKYDVKTT